MLRLKILVVTQFRCPSLLRWLHLDPQFEFIFRENDPGLTYREPVEVAATVLLLDRHSSPSSTSVRNFVNAYAPLFIGNLPAPGRVDRMLAPATAEIVQALNEEIEQYGSVMDMRGLAADLGNGLWYSSRTLLYDMPWSAVAQDQAANLILETLRRYFFGRKKLLITDLDGVMWGGLAGEGPITLGREGLGRAYANYQDELRLLKESGILLAICSKNDPDSVVSILQKHPGMRLEYPHDFVASAISWESKSRGIVDILARLDLAPDSAVFLDDNPLERAEIQTQFPQITTPVLPLDPADYAGFIRRMTCFDTLHVTDEDRQRTQFYQARAQRQALSQSLDRRAFLDSLAMQVTIEPVSAATAARFCELSQRTTQFTTTTNRYTVPPEHSYVIRLQDKFGDEGIVGGAVVAGRTLESLFISCRVIGRGVEDAFYCWLYTKYYDGYRFEIPVVPTERNTPAQAWVARVTKEGPPTWPNWIKSSATRWATFPPASGIR